MYTDLLEDMEKLRAQNASLENNIQAAHQTLRATQEEVNICKEALSTDRNASEIRYRDLYDEKEAIISQLNDDVADI